MVTVDLFFSYFLRLFELLLPILKIPEAYFTDLDKAFAFLIDLVSASNYFVPVDTLIMCMGIMVAVDHWQFFNRIGVFIIKLVRG